METADNPQSVPILQQPHSARDLLARLALAFSVFAFLVPLGIAAVVLGHISEARLRSGPSLADENDRYLARAALWIAYLQLALVLLMAVVAWGLFHGVAEGFQRDAMVQRIFRASDELRTLDPESAREAESTAHNLVNELIAIEDQVYRENGAYVCDVDGLVATGLEGATDAENRALAGRLADSPYLYEIRDCTPVTKEFAKYLPEARYTLIAVPRLPRMPEGSASFCSDQGGVVHTSHGRTSLDCFDREKSSPLEPAAKPEAGPEVPRILR
ncbi:MAG TPA: DUF4190 domain-containing protein [Candidatus Acidoferrales bacterium]|nr:DUF4190 domain-containing protein [Candidatus Acidoferrales bacterium]